MMEVFAKKSSGETIKIRSSNEKGFEYQSWITYKWQFSASFQGIAGWSHLLQKMHRDWGWKEIYIVL